MFKVGDLVRNRLDDNVLILSQADADLWYVDAFKIGSMSPKSIGVVLRASSQFHVVELMTNGIVGWVFERHLELVTEKEAGGSEDPPAKDR